MTVGKALGLEYEPVQPATSQPRPTQTTIALRIVSDDTGTYFEASSGKARHLRRECKQALRAVIADIPDDLAGLLLERGEVTIKIAR